MYKLIKKAKFEMAHKLTDSYSDECQNIHGHSYTLEVIVKTDSLNEHGMVIDLKLLGELINEMILKDLDHKFLVWQEDPVFQALNEIQGIEVTPTVFNPTAENMAEDIHNILYPELTRVIPTLDSLIICLHETATGSVKFTR